ncbi:hypothetical protein OGAPHI_003481 [Ogataea philodendri]|uniref:Nuclear protein localization protein 4 n=1 Tax=Ogataea philodendri TaxID=1378263 RepID=A0A9P8T5W2_9ASCO|nr:uncharacterized protein OGAPHI_003481 [Ogataea philodendri]KAH3666485.1 hypothetical protein OGAPHI_003481 [Ogataea philodendri]
MALVSDNQLHSNNQVLRFRSKDGMFRLNTGPSSAFGTVLDELATKLPPFKPESLKIATKPGDAGQLALNLKDSTVQGLNLKHGEMLYLSYEPAELASSVNISQVKETQTIKQLQIDNIYDKEEGLIPRKRTSLCRHTDKGMCEYCSPLPPWDKDYQQQHNIKHISFHAHINELNSLANKKESGSSYISPLSESNFSINKKCPGGHDPWPKGICSKCQPSAVTLQRQNFRMVDHVEFQDSEIINEFINTWRMSGAQRIGLMFGSYDKYEKVPLGIKAKVEAIYEFPQVDQEDGLILQNWEDEEKVLSLAKRLDLVPVGIIFTDLLDAGTGNGSVICKRHKDSFFLSSLEAIFAIKWQLKFPNICKWSDSEKFSSKFVTCVISGNTSGEIDIEAYQISESGEGLVKADLISPSTHPNEVFINEQNDVRYVPEIFYQKFNEYGLQVKEKADPSFPVEYLLVSLTHGFPEKSSPYFKAGASNKFPVENRGYIGESATMPDLKNYLSAVNGDNAEELGQLLSNFHLLIYFTLNQDILSGQELELIVEIVRKLGKGENAMEEEYKLVDSDGWRNLQTILQVGY